MALWARWESAGMALVVLNLAARQGGEGLSAPNSGRLTPE